jgi:hypothetical protein
MKYSLSDIFLAFIMTLGIFGGLMYIVQFLMEHICVLHR